MMRLAVRFADQYPELDRDLLILGVLFHDLGKVGLLVGHVVLGRDLLRERVAAIPGFPDDLRLQLEHRSQPPGTQGSLRRSGR
ncbi:MAG: HD domain-containing protein [Thermoanaerobaculia bacterium]